MNLTQAIDYVSDLRPTWKTARGVWRAPHKYNRAHVLRLLGETRNVKTIKKSDLAAMRAKLQREGRSNAGINRIMAFLNTTLRELADSDIIVKQPKLPALPENNARQEWYSRGQIDDLVRVSREELGDNELADAILFALYTGCRQANLLGLQVGDVDFESSTINFRETKDGDDYSVDIHPELLPILEIKCAGEDPGTRVFEFANKDALWKSFKQARALAGLGEEMKWHTFRHTCGTWLAEAEVPIQTIAKVLGHKTLDMSIRYSKISDKARKSAINKL